MPRMRMLGLIFIIAATSPSGPPSPVLAQEPAPVENVSTFPHRSPEEERKALHVPPGFEIQLVAAEPDIQKPLNIAFDDRGRLWVTDTVEYPYGAEEGAKPRDTVKILSDFGPDGRARKLETFADDLNIPIGVLPLPSARAALVHSIPNVYLLRDDDGDGQADHREVFYGEIGHRDTHGMTNSFTWGFDGWIYACHGFSNTSTIAGKDGQAITMNSGNVYRMRPDGSHLQQITHGQVNPFGLSFDSMGNLYSCDCHSRPAYQLIRGGYYPSFGKPDDGLGFAPEMVSHDHGSTGISGISYYTASQFPEEYRGTVFIGNVVTNRINHDTVEWRGSSPKGIEQPDFLWSEDNWFRPVDIELGPDGALYVADFYNRIIGHYEVPLTHPGRDRTSGRIWRIVYKGDAETAPPPVMVDRVESSVDSLIDDLKDDNLAVRIAATNQLVDRGGAEALGKLRALLTTGSDSSVQTVHALWAVERLGKVDDELLMRVADGAEDPLIRVHGLRVLVDRPALPPRLETFALRSIDDVDPNVRRAAAEVLGSHADLDHVRPLLNLVQTTAAEDDHLIHVARIALRDQLKRDDVWERLDALTLNPRDLDDLADVAVAVPTPQAAAFLLDRMRTAEPSQADLARFTRLVARYGEGDPADALLAIVESGDRSADDRLTLLRMILQGAQERGQAPNANVQGAALGLVVALLNSADADAVGRGISVARDLRLKETIPTLEAVSGRADLPEARRAEASSAVVDIDPSQAMARLKATLDDGDSPPPVREAAAIALANIDRPEARAAVLDSLATLPEALQSTAAAALVRHKEGAGALLEAVAAGEASARLLQERPITIGLENAEIPNLAERIAKLLDGLPPADQKLQELIDARRESFLAASKDPAAGAGVFETHCGVCHQMEGKGANVGPQLDGIGVRGLDRLLEDLLDPNRNVDQNFRVTNLALADGRVISGLLLREEGQVLVLVDSLGKEIRVPADEVEERQTAQISPMPADLATQIPKADFNNLLEFLLDHREEKPSR